MASVLILIYIQVRKENIMQVHVTQNGNPVKIADCKPNTITSGVVDGEIVIQTMGEDAKTFVRVAFGMEDIARLEKLILKLKGE